MPGYIDYIRLIFFQSHRDTTISLHPGVTAITGESDVGKSSVVRAIKWVMTNRPKGLGYCSDFADGPTEVHIALTAGPLIKRIRSKDINRYEIHIGDDKPKVFDTVKFDVPKPVLALLNLADYNVRGQHDGPYLVADSRPAVARTLNNLVGAGAADEAVRLSNIEIQTVGQAVAQLGIKVERKDLAIAGFQGAGDLVEGVELVKGLVDEYHRLGSRTIALSRGLERALELQEVLSLDADLIQGARALLDRLDEMIKEHEALRRWGSKLSVLAIQGQQASDYLEVAESKLAWAKGEATKIIGATGDCPICDHDLGDIGRERLMDWIFK